MKTLRRCAAFFLLAWISASATGCTRDTSASTWAPGYRDAPVFFEIHFADYVDSLNIDLLARGSVRLQPLGTESIENFDWVNHKRTDRSWWHRIENFVYLLPYIQSNNENERRFAADWLRRWYAAHESNAEPNVGAWDGMTAGIRVMVFIAYMKCEERRAQPNEQVLAWLRTSVGWHQRFLAQEENFESNSNHGMWESMGLFETTRVVPDTSLTALALRRLLRLTNTSVTSQGAHREHAVGYHFYFLQWLTQYVDYLVGLKGLTWEGMNELATIERKMRAVSRYLYDHRLNVPQVGDTDERRIEESRTSRWPAPADPVFFDKEAGYAIYKDLPPSDRKRYLIFRIQNREFQPDLPHHVHNDMLSVYYSDDGEVILGDQGRYTYTREPIRAYLMSLAAHNTVLPTSLVVPRAPGIYVAERVWSQRDSRRILFGAGLTNDAVIRTVEIPEGDAGLRVSDTIAIPDPFLLLWHVGADVVDVHEVARSRDGAHRSYEWKLTTRRQREFLLSVRISGISRQPAADEVKVLEGEKDPYLGWRSPRYSVLEPAPTIRIDVTPVDTIRVSTTITKQ